MTNKQVIEQWAEYVCGYNSKPEGHNSNGSIYYKGDVIYSYGSHFPMAIFMGGRCTVINGDKYSPTTSRHQSTLRGVISDYCIDEIVISDTSEMRRKIS